MFLTITVILKKIDVKMTNFLNLKLKIIKILDTLGSNCVNAIFNIVVFFLKFIQCFIYKCT